MSYLIDLKKYLLVQIILQNKVDRQATGSPIASRVRLRQIAGHALRQLPPQIHPLLPPARVQWTLLILHHRQKTTTLGRSRQVVSNVQQVSRLQC